MSSKLQSIISNNVFLLLLCIAKDVNSNGICDGVPEMVLQPDVLSCEKFFICIGGLPVYGVCPDNYRFNKVTSECAKQETVACDIILEEKPKELIEVEINDQDIAAKLEDKVARLEKDVIDMELCLGTVKEKLKEVEVI